MVIIEHAIHSISMITVDKTDHALFAYVTKVSGMGLLFLDSSDIIVRYITVYELSSFYTSYFKAI